MYRCHSSYRYTDIVSYCTSRFRYLNHNVAVHQSLQIKDRRTTTSCTRTLFIIVAYRSHTGTPVSQYTMSLLAKRFWNSRNAIRRAKSTSATVFTNISQDDVVFAKEYSELPGPKSLPLLGNNWRFMSYIGKYAKYIESYSGGRLY